jgi:hypothetical protein
MIGALNHRGDMDKGEILRVIHKNLLAERFLISGCRRARREGLKRAYCRCILPADQKKKGDPSQKDQDDAYAESHPVSSYEPRFMVAALMAKCSE